MKRLLPFVLFLAAIAAYGADPKPVHVFVVGTTDLHGSYDSHHESKTAPPYGGLPLIAGYLNVLRANHGRVIVVDSGDLFQGTLESNFFEGEPVLKGYNALGYDAAAVGNHEFDYGPAGPDSVVRRRGEDPVGALKKNAKAAKFPFLSANLFERRSGKTPPWAKRYTMIEANGVKVGIIGLSTPDTPAVTTSSNVSELYFGDPVAATLRAAGELRAAGASAIVVIAHMGGRCKNIDVNPEDSSACEKDQEAMRYLAALPKGTIDAYFAGHTHSNIRHYINGVATLQPLPFGRELAILDMTIDPAQHKVTKTEMAPLTMVCAQVYEKTETCDPKKAPAGAALVPKTLEGKPVAEVSAVAAIFKPYLAQVAVKKNEDLGIRTTDRFKRAYYRECALGDVLTDAMRTVMKADIAFLNSGGIRTDLPAGTILYSHMFDVSPFDNFPAIVTITGAQVKRMLEITSIGGGRGILQASGLRYTFDESRDADKPAAQRNRLLSVTLADGRPLDPVALYRVATVDFLVTGEGLEPLMKTIPPDRIKIDYSRPIREVLIEGMKAMPQPMTPKVDERITVVNPVGSGD
ncbi:MAG TPA: 5'-nucleotidase C-terminal domain-containing protein [Thermoanaerobaculia bacterium]|jgi:5'-nucleotidase|nr:5'-nucleotidase C-terminal domain-containing protein [Thermoanaerobaculia bacterium]